MSPPPAPLFDDAAVPLPLLRQRAFNQRWAEQPEGVIPLTSADPDFPAAAVIREALVAHGLALVPGSPRWFGPGGAGHVRLCFATSEAILAEGLRRFSAGMAAAQPGRGSSG